MPFITIKGTYRLTGMNQQGNATGFQPDGDSIQFKPDNPLLLDQLERLGHPYKLTGIGSLNLRFEGIDTLELHYQSVGPLTFQPFAAVARDFLTGQLGMNPVPYVQPKNIVVDPPVPVDAVPGYILSRNLEFNGRPVSFAYAGNPPDPDGTKVILDACRLQSSLNYRLVAAGHAYPLFYDTLFADLRMSLAMAARSARKLGFGVWAGDLTTAGIVINGVGDLEVNGVIFPKLFRRLVDYMRKLNTTDLTGFPHWVATEEEEQVLDLAETNFTHFDNIIGIIGNVVALQRRPEDVVFVSKKRIGLD
jgi:hypothetical protein